MKWHLNHKWAHYRQPISHHKEKTEETNEMYKVTGEQQEEIIDCHEDLKQQLQAKTQRLRKYTMKTDQYWQNKTLKEDAKKFYRELGKQNIKTESHQVHKKPSSSSKTSWNKRWNMKIPNGSKNKSKNSKS